MRQENELFEMDLGMHPLNELHCSNNTYETVTAYYKNRQYTLLLHFGQMQFEMNSSLFSTFNPH